MARLERLLSHPAWLAAAVAAVEAVVAVVLSLAPNREGAIAGAGYAVMYVAPALVVAAGVQSPHRGLRDAAGWAALVIAVLYAGVVVGNWPGYSAAEAAFAMAVNVPAAVAYLVIFWAVVVHRPRRTATG